MPSDFNVKRGDTLVFKETFTYTDTGLPVNITNWVIWFTLKKNEDDLDSSAVVKRQFTNFTDPTLGKVTLIVATPTETYSLLGKYFFDIQYKDGDGIVRTPDSGTINFTRDITRATSMSSSSSCRSSSSSSSSSSCRSSSSSSSSL
jgi:hypothetical protein